MGRRGRTETVADEVDTRRPRRLLHGQSLPLVYVQELLSVLRSRTHSIASLSPGQTGIAGTRSTDCDHAVKDDVKFLLSHQVTSSTSTSKSITRGEKHARNTVAASEPWTS